MTRGVYRNYLVRIVGNVMEVTDLLTGKKVIGERTRVAKAIDKQVG